MQIKLTQSGGLTGTKMAATAKSTLTEEEWNSLIEAVKKPVDADKKKRDSLHYTLQKTDDANSKESIDIRLIPESHNELFKKLFDELKPEKK